MLQAEDTLEQRIDTLMESPTSQVVPAEEDGPTGNFLLQDFLKKRLDDSFDEGYDSDLLLKINHFLEQEVLGGDEDEFDDGKAGKSAKNTDDNVAEQIALLKSSKGKAPLRDSEVDIEDNSLKQPLVGAEVLILPAVPKRTKPFTECQDAGLADNETEHCEIESAKAETEMYTVQDYDGDLGEAHGLPASKPEVAVDALESAELQSALDDYEFKSAVEFQSVFNFSKHGDAK